MLRKILPIALIACAASASASANLKVEEAIKYRQSAYTFIAWNMGRIRANTEGEFNRDEVVQAANAIQAAANSGLGSLFVPGIDKGKGWIETRAKSELFTDGAGVGKVAMRFNQEANALAAIAGKGDPAAVKAQLGKLGSTCKSCHDSYRAKAAN